MQNLMKASYLWLIPLEASCTEASDHVSLFNPSPPLPFYSSPTLERRW